MFLFYLDTHKKIESGGDIFYSNIKYKFDERII